MLKDDNYSEIFNLNRAFLNILHEKGITSPKTLSEMTGIDKATISRQMSNKQALSLSNISKYSDVLKVHKGKFIEEYVPSFWIIGYVDMFMGRVTGRQEEDPQKVVFSNEFEKIDNEKILYDKRIEFLLRYNTSLNQKTVPHEKLYNSECFIRTKGSYMTGFVGTITEINKDKVTFNHLGNIITSEFYMIYVITSTHNMKFKPDHIAIIDG